MTTFNELLFTELRTIPVPVQNDNISDDDLVRAMTDHDNLTTLGFCLKPKDIITLAKAKDFSVYNTVKPYMDKIKAKPMYPDFPLQVMEMDEAVFRFHQMVHYFSTYGMKTLFGVNVKKGWMPDVPETEKTKKQTIVLPKKTLSFVPEKDKYNFVLKTLLTKRERLTIPEKELVTTATIYADPAIFNEITIPFKENLMDLFLLFFDRNNTDIIYNICQHTGDVFTCLRYTLTRHHYRFSTSEKKRAVRILEHYPIGDFKTNLILSNKKAKNSFIILDYISYNKFSRSLPHKLAVKDFRDGKLRSWESGMKKRIFNKDDDVLPYIATRPGILLRMVAWLIRLGYPENDIKDALVENAKSLSTQTLITILNNFGSAKFADREESEAVYRIVYAALTQKYRTIETPLHNKKVFLEEGIYDFDHSRIEANDKSDEGGYIRSGMVFKIPEDVHIVRFFVYWNDKDTVDVDLHSNAILTNGEPLHIGWNADYNRNGICTSGDITHSDAAEYIDINLDKTNVALCQTVIHLYGGKNTLGNIETCFTGMMGINRAGKDIQLYSPANCFFHHNLKSPARALHYAMIDPQKRLLQVIAKPTTTTYIPITSETKIEAGFSIRQYIDILMKTQNITLTKTKEEADITLRLDKGGDISLIDENFFMDM